MDGKSLFVQWRLLATVIVFVCMSLANKTTHADTQQTGAAVGEIALGSQLELLEDPSLRQHLDEVMKSDRWMASTHPEPNIGFSRSAWWARATIKLPEGLQGRWHLEFNDAPINLVDVYFIDQRGRSIHKHGGNWTAVSSRDVPYRTQVFSIPEKLLTGESLTFYVRAESKLGIVFSLRMLSQNQFAAVNTSDTLVYAAYFGFLGSLAVFNFISWLTNREINFLLYASFSVCLITFGLSFSGLGHQFLWKNLGELDNYLLILSLLIGSLLFNIFMERFLFGDSDYEAPLQKPRRHFLSVMSASGLYFLLADDLAIAVNIEIATVMAAIINVAINLASVHARKVPNLKLVITSLAVLILACLLFGGRTLGWVPSNFVTTNAVQIAALIDTFLLVIAIIENSQFRHHLQSQANARMRKDLEQEAEARTRELLTTKKQLSAQEKFSTLEAFSSGISQQITPIYHNMKQHLESLQYAGKGCQSYLSGLLYNQPDREPGEEFTGFFSRLEHSTITISTGLARIATVSKALGNTQGDANTMTVYTGPVTLLEKMVEKYMAQKSIGLQIEKDFRSNAGINISQTGLEQVFNAILHNAMYAMEQCKIQQGSHYSPILSLGSERENNELVIRIEDNGLGIKASNLNKIFEPFFTTKAVGHGAGLGLTIVKDVMAKYDGSVKVDSTEDEGTCVTLRLHIAGE